MQRGHFYVDKHFQFSDGATGKKIILCLNNPSPGEPFLVLKTTSQEKRYKGLSGGCHTDRFVFFLSSSYSDPLDKPTYVHMNEIFPYQQDDYEEFVSQGDIHYIGSFAKEHHFNELLNCLRLLKEDIEVRNFRMIFG